MEEVAAKARCEAAKEAYETLKTEYETLEKVEVDSENQLQSYHGEVITARKQARHYTKKLAALRS